MLDWLINLDKDLLLEINGTHAPLLDHIMVFVSAKWSGIPIYAAILYMIFHKRSPKTAIVMVCAILLTFALTDYLSVHLIKNNICRLRPGWDPTLESIVRLLENKGGRYGFISTHAANFFGLAYISSKLLKKNWYTIFIFIWSIVVGYSRVYVAKHFPGDVIYGATFGLLMGYLVYLLYKFIVKKYNLPQDVVHK